MIFRAEKPEKKKETAKKPAKPKAKATEKGQTTLKFKVGFISKISSIFMSHDSPERGVC